MINEIKKIQNQIVDQGIDGFFFDVLSGKFESSDDFGYIILKNTKENKNLNSAIEFLKSEKFQVIKKCSFNLSDAEIENQHQVLGNITTLEEDLIIEYNIQWRDLLRELMIFEQLQKIEI